MALPYTRGVRPRAATRGAALAPAVRGADSLVDADGDASDLLVPARSVEVPDVAAPSLCAGGTGGLAVRPALPTIRRGERVPAPPRALAAADVGFFLGAAPDSDDNVGGGGGGGGGDVLHNVLQWTRRHLETEGEGGKHLPSYLALKTDVIKVRLHVVRIATGPEHIASFRLSGPAAQRPSDPAIV